MNSNCTTGPAKKASAVLRFFCSFVSAVFGALAGFAGAGGGSAIAGFGVCGFCVSSTGCAVTAGGATFCAADEITACSTTAGATAGDDVPGDLPVTNGDSKNASPPNTMVAMEY